jgi:putative hydrolase of the HAD superfamily
MYDRIFSEQEQHIGELSNKPAVFKNGFEFRLDRFNRLLQGLHILNSNMPAELTNVYGKSKIRNLRAFSEVPQVLLKLRKSFVLGIITNGFSDLQNEELDALGLRVFFDYVIISQEVGMRKPDEKIFLEALRRTSTQPDRFLMIGDKLKDDILTPKRLGMHAGLVLHGKKPDYDLRVSPDFTIQNLNFLPNLVQHP